MHVVIGVWIEEVPVVGVEIDAFDVDALGVDNPMSRRASARTSMIFMPGRPMMWCSGWQSRRKVRYSGWLVSDTTTPMGLSMRYSRFSSGGGLK